MDNFGAVQDTPLYSLMTARFVSVTTAMREVLLFEKDDCYARVFVRNLAGIVLSYTRCF